jgi:hypothetical protein
MAGRFVKYKVAQGESRFRLKRARPLEEPPMARTRPVKRILLAATCGAVMVPLIASLASSAPADPTGHASAAAQDEFEHKVTRQAAKGRFQCGDLTLTIVAGMEIETQDGSLRNGVAHVFINRVWRHVKLKGSDGDTYRATGVSSAWFVLKAPDFNRPVRGDENNTVVFRSAADSSPGYLQERLTIKDGKEKDAVRGPCDFADG